ncbi:hypothetical protein GMRT_10488 [Giardia muris]|uniref:Uncharacterized protein n=1 Tax=Giardia muris TaxID=5742 RepID=A0A4Z1T279_GIAMU|nr:hypothetical protein GMRT_10488 [Giardia muris]|eukprot:TNJ26521.1 hypothetical protein GMRT_10488 [Giardia muris]
MEQQVCGRARALIDTGDSQGALKLLTNFVESQKVLTHKASGSRAPTAPFPAVMRLLTELAVKERATTAVRQAYNQYRYLFAWTVPSTVEDVFYDLLANVKQVVADIDGDFDVRKLDVTDQQGNPIPIFSSHVTFADPDCQRIAYVFGAFRMILDVLRGSSLVQLYHDVIDSFCLFCGRFERLLEFQLVVERIVGCFAEPKSEAIVTPEILALLQDAKVTGETDSQVGGDAPISEPDHPGVLAVKCRLICVPYCRAFSFLPLAHRLLEDAARDIHKLRRQISDTLSPLEAPTEYSDDETVLSKVVEERFLSRDSNGELSLSVEPEIIETQVCAPPVDIWTTYRVAEKVPLNFSSVTTPATTLSMSTPPTSLGFAKEVGATTGTTSSRFGETPLSSEAYLSLTLYHLQLAMSVLEAGGFTLAAALCRYKTLKLSTILSDETRRYMLNGTICACLSLRALPQPAELDAHSIRLAGLSFSTPSTLVTVPACAPTVTAIVAAREVTLTAQLRTICLEHSHAFRHLPKRPLDELSFVPENASLGERMLQDLLAYHDDVFPSVRALAECLRWRVDDSKASLAEAAKQLIALATEDNASESSARLHRALVCHTISQHFMAVVMDPSSLETETVTLAALQDVLKPISEGKFANPELFAPAELLRLAKTVFSRGLVSGRYSYKERAFTIDLAASRAALGIVVTADKYVDTATKTPPSLSSELCLKLRAQALRDHHFALKARLQRVLDAKAQMRRELQRYRTELLEREQRDAELNARVTKEQSAAYRAAEIHSTQVKMAQQFIERVAVQMHDDELIAFFNEIDVASLESPYDDIKRRHASFEKHRAEVRVQHGIKAANMAELTLRALRLHATPELRRLDQEEAEVLEARLRELYAAGLKQQSEDHVTAQRERRHYAELIGLADFVAEYRADCEAAYQEQYSQWRNRRAAVLSEIEAEKKREQEKVVAARDDFRNRLRSKNSARPEPSAPTEPVSAPAPPASKGKYVPPHQRQ